MKKVFLVGISAVLLIPLAPLIDWAYYRDRKSFVPPIHYAGELSIRNDTYGDGHFGASRKGRRLHKGVDIHAPLRSEVMASRGGRVKAGYQKNGMGKFIIIEHYDGYSTLYGHLSGLCVKDGQRVCQGTVIGHTGKTGNANYAKIQPHLHFELRRGDQYLDPLPLLEEHN